MTNGLEWRSARLLCRATLVCFIAFAFGPGSASGQQTEASSYQGFEGRTVNRLDIAAGPAMEIESFRPLLKQKVNEPFSIQDIQESVAFLQKTGLFSQVQVKVQP